MTFTRYALSDLDMDQADYDGRTALHVGAAEGHEAVVRFLINKCKCNPFLVDRLVVRYFYRLANKV